jgi:hypothetical protein
VIGGPLVTPACHGLPSEWVGAARIDEPCR